VWDKIDDLTREEQAWVKHRNRKGSSEIERLLWKWRSLDIKGKNWMVNGCWIWRIDPNRICEGEKMKGKVVLIYLVRLVFRINEVILH